MTRQFSLSLFSLILIFLLSACGVQDTDEKPPLRLKEASFSSLKGWGDDDLRTFIPAFEKSCQIVFRRADDRMMGPLQEAGTAKRWKELCSAFQAMRDGSAPIIRRFFENNFTPYAVYAGSKAEGLFTGYYEASLKGSLKKTGPYQYPLHGRPDDLVMVHLGQFRDHLKGERIAGRVIDGTLKPYETREEIVAGDWPHPDEVLLYVSNPVDAFFLQIQGSGRVELREGGYKRIGYAGQNGHPYYAIGRELIKREHLEKDEVSMQSIRAWLEANPDEAQEIMNTNKSYVFFRELKEDGPVGGSTVTLTPGRSLAIDRSLISYGLPIWVDIEEPIDGAGPIRKLMVTQDTGGAIRGPVRGDVFWGYGEMAETLAGGMKSDGRYWVLLPKVQN